MRHIPTHPCTHFIAMAPTLVSWALSLLLLWASCLACGALACPGWSLTIACVFCVASVCWQLSLAQHDIGLMSFTHGVRETSATPLNPNQPCIKFIAVAQFIIRCCCCCCCCGWLAGWPALLLLLLLMLWLAGCLPALLAAGQLAVWLAGCCC